MTWILFITGHAGLPPAPGITESPDMPNKFFIYNALIWIAGYHHQGLLILAAEESRNAACRSSDGFFRPFFP
jgi:hypothetical protein